jgi:elongation factor Tu
VAYPVREVSALLAPKFISVQTLSAVARPSLFNACQRISAGPSSELPLTCGFHYGLFSRITIYYTVLINCHIVSRRGYAEAYSRAKPHLNIGTIGKWFATLLLLVAKGFKHM